MKKTCIFLIICLVCSLLAGCAATASGPVTVEEPVFVTAAPPAQTHTPEPTIEPTAEPTGSPTAEPTSEPTPEPAAEATPEDPTPTPVAAGRYTYNSPNGTWELSLRDDGLFTLTGPDGSVHTGEGWTTEADGTVSCGPTDIYGEDFVFDGGSSRWQIDRGTCTPVAP